VMEDGRVVETGSHAELLAREGAYSRLYALQFSGEDTNEQPAAASAEPPAAARA